MLRDIKLEPVYDSAECNLIKDLFIPLLSNSSVYLRGVGYFASGWLKLTAEGLGRLIANGGKAQFVTSPIVASEDLEAFRKGVAAKDDKLLYLTLKKNLIDISSLLEADTLNTMAWMIADGLLDFRFAIPHPNINGDYHDKVGIFIDDNDDFIAIHGSFNDTYKGSLNGEAFSVFKSWEKGHEIFAQRHLHRLEDLWTKGNSQFQIVPLPDSLKNDFIKLRSGDRPYEHDFKKHTPEKIEFKKKLFPANPYILKDYQEDAIRLWSENHNHGILEMATGTGKTITSLAAAVKCLEENKNLFLVIIVPFLHLAEQWSNVCKRFNIDPICCSGSHSNWKTELNSLLRSFKLGTLQMCCAIVVKDTAIGESFQTYVKKIPAKHLMLIVDEAHYLGAPKLQKALFENAKYRLGLSATPDRWMDTEGTDILKKYFNDIVYRFTLEDAIEQGFLTKYEYWPVLVELTNDEIFKYESLSKEVARLSSRCNSKKKNEGSKKQLEMKLLERARLVWQSNNKQISYAKLIRKLQKNDTLKHLLVFCAPGKHRDVLSKTRNLGIKSHEFVHTVSYNDRQNVLEAFASGHIEAIISIKCMDEGVDVPSTELAIFMASTTNPKEFIQRRGRVLRTHEGKDKAIIYDFITVPPNGTSVDVGASLLRRELPRFAEFSGAAMNKYDAREIIRPILEKYGVDSYIDEKPWDIYKQDIENNEV